MVENDKNEGGGPREMLRGLLAVLALAVVAVGVILFLQHRSVTESGGPAAQVAMIDSEAIYALPEFTKVKKELDDLSDKMKKELVATIQAKKLDDQDAERLREQMRDKLQQEQRRRVTPLYRRVTAAIAILAQKNHYRVVLDKRIVVTGVVDITDAVKKEFESLQDADLSKLPMSADGNSTIGYVDQDAVADLRIFKDAQAQILVEYQQMAARLQKEAQGKSPSVQEQMRQAMVVAFQQREAALMKPVEERVKQVITQVARQKGLSLVLNSRHIMWGGQNLTDDVIKKLVDPAS